VDVESNGIDSNGECCDEGGEPAKKTTKVLEFWCFVYHICDGLKCLINEIV
jgi:hypothetical protein